MLSRILALTAAILCALWVQGVVLCVGDEGHAEFEVEGMSCCPEDTGECHDCVDMPSPDPMLPGAVATPGPVTAAVCPNAALPSRLVLPNAGPELPAALSSLRSVILIV